MYRKEGFEKYKRTNVAEMRPVTEEDIEIFESLSSDELWFISISSEDLKNGSPRLGDYIARNPKNHKDQWLVAEKYTKDNFEKIKND